MLSLTRSRNSSRAGLTSREVIVLVGVVTIVALSVLVLMDTRRDPHGPPCKRS